jgi:hypothetical protein
MNNYRLTETAEHETYARFLNAWWTQRGPTPIAVRDLLELAEAAPLVGQYSNPKGRVIALARMIGANRETRWFLARVARWGRSYRRTRSGSNVILPTLWELEPVENTPSQPLRIPARPSRPPIEGRPLRAVP